MDLLFFCKNCDKISPQILKDWQVARKQEWKNEMDKEVIMK